MGTHDGEYSPDAQEVMLGPISGEPLQIYKESPDSSVLFFNGVQDVICTDRLKHADAVTKAKQAVYEAKVLRDRMTEQGIYVERYDSLYNLAKAVEAEAVAALRRHRKEHSC